jgi:hypothetical protein
VSGVQRWKGTRETLKPITTRSIPQPRSPMGLICAPEAIPAIASGRWKVPLEVYTRAIPNARKPVATAPRTRYFSPASAPCGSSLWKAIRIYSTRVNASRPRKKPTREVADESRAIPAAAKRIKAVYSPPAKRRSSA